jgi:hypothetical protein
MKLELKYQYTYDESFFHVTYVIYFSHKYCTENLAGQVCTLASQFSTTKENMKQISDIVPEQNHKGNIKGLQLVICSCNQSNIR